MPEPNIFKFSVDLTWEGINRYARKHPIKIVLIVSGLVLGAAAFVTGVVLTGGALAGLTAVGVGAGLGTLFLTSTAAAAEIGIATTVAGATAVTAAAAYGLTDYRSDIRETVRKKRALETKADNHPVVLELTAISERLEQLNANENPQRAFAKILEEIHSYEEYIEQFKAARNLPQNTWSKEYPYIVASLDKKMEMLNETIRKQEKNLNLSSPAVMLGTLQNKDKFFEKHKVVVPRPTTEIVQEAKSEAKRKKSWFARKDTIELSKTTDKFRLRKINSRK